MSINANPSLNPADIGTLTGTLRHVFNKLTQRLDGSLPARVIAYDRDAKRASVQPQIAVLTTNNTLVTRAAIASVPVVQLSGGGFVLDFPLKSGDTGWVIACDRDISAYLKYLAVAAPATVRIKNFADGYFLPSALLNYTIAEEDADNLVLQTYDGTVKISLGANKIKVAAPTVEVDATTTAIITAPQVTINASGSLDLNVSGFSFTGSAARINIDATVPVQINNSAYIDGEIIATGNILANTPIPP